MAGTPKNVEALVLALAGGLGVAAAARQAQVSERTAYRRLAEPEFRRRVEAARAELVSQAIGRLAAAGGAAGGRLIQLIAQGTSETVQLGACRAVLEYMLRGVEVDTLARELAELRREVEEIRRGDVNATARGRQATGGAGRAPDGAPGPGSASA